MQEGHAEVVRVLCEAGVGPIMHTSGGPTPFNMALQVRTPQCFVMFAVVGLPTKLLSGAQRNHVLMWPWSCSRRMQLPSCAQLMAARVGSGSVSGCKAVCTAMICHVCYWGFIHLIAVFVLQNGHAEIARYLLQVAAAPDQQTSHGFNPMILTAEVSAV